MQNIELANIKVFIFLLYAAEPLYTDRQRQLLMLLIYNSLQRRQSRMPGSCNGRFNYLHIHSAIKASYPCRQFDVTSCWDFWYPINIMEQCCKFHYFSQSNQQHCVNSFLQKWNFSIIMSFPFIALCWRQRRRTSIYSENFQ